VAAVGRDVVEVEGPRRGQRGAGLGAEEAARGVEVQRLVRLDPAREPLSHGLRLARICGAQPLVARAEQELRATGASTRDVIVAGLDALTASERRVCEMAAEGLTNKQIAQTLYVTIKTVETHLRRAYMKLDISSRGQLAKALEPGPSPERSGSMSG
jgi:DNA-binding CsgD family transcriptional regulator